MLEENTSTRFKVCYGWFINPNDSYRTRSQSHFVCCATFIGARRNFFKFRPAVLSAHWCQSQWYLELKHSRMRLSPVGNATTFCTLQTCSVHFTHFSVFNATIFAFFDARYVHDVYTTLPSETVYYHVLIPWMCLRSCAPQWLKRVLLFPVMAGKKAKPKSKKKCEFFVVVIFFLCSFCLSSSCVCVCRCWNLRSANAVGTCGQGCEKADACKGAIRLWGEGTKADKQERVCHYRRQVPKR